MCNWAKCVLTKHCQLNFSGTKRLSVWKLNVTFVTCIENTHFKCLKCYYRDSHVEVTHLFLECINCELIQKYIGGYTMSSINRKFVHCSSFLLVKPRTSFSISIIASWIVFSSTSASIFDPISVNTLQMNDECKKQVISRDEITSFCLQSLFSLY